MRKFLLVLMSTFALFVSGCMIPDLPDDGTCRSFYVSSWGGGAPWDELNWQNEIAWIDEPLIPPWRNDSDLGNPAWVQAETDKLRIKIDNFKAAGKIVWINWATEEQDALEAYGIPVGLNADIVSVDSYGGMWDWGFNTKPRLNRIHNSLGPEQWMGLVPEGHYAPDWGVRETEAEEAAVATFYIDYAFNHDRVYALAPFTWGPCDGCMSERPFVAVQYFHAKYAYPLCNPPVIAKP